MTNRAVLAQASRARQSLENGRATREHDIGVQILADVDVTLADETWLEQHFLATEAFGANRDDVTVWELEGKRHVLASTTDWNPRSAKTTSSRVSDTCEIGLWQICCTPEGFIPLYKRKNVLREDSSVDLIMDLSPDRRGNKQ